MIFVLYLPGFTSLVLNPCDFTGVFDARNTLRNSRDICALLSISQSAEEKDHALALADYVIKRGGEANVGMIDVVPQGWGSLQDVFNSVYEHECNVSKLVDDLVDVASAERDKATQDFLWGFVREQVEEEATALEIVDRLRKAGEAGAFFVDAELGKR